MGRKVANVTVTVPEELKRMMERVHGVNWSEIARRAFEETIRRRRMLEASQTMDQLRESTKIRGWSGVREIRKWRDRESKS